MIKNMILRTALAVIAIPSLFGADRFDTKIRNDFFAGFNGDKEAFSRAMKASEEVIAAKPAEAAEALAWHGSGLLLMAGAKFQEGDFQNGGQMWGRANAEMDQAGKMEPNNIGVLIPRSAAWFAAARNVPKEMQKPLLEKAIADYEHVYDIQKDTFETLHIHNKSELLFGLADGYARMGDNAKAKMYFEKLAALGQKSGHLEQATGYLDSGKYTVTGAGCAGCHVGK